jgi:hypothetical protein
MFKAIKVACVFQGQEILKMGKARYHKKKKKKERKRERKI